MKNLTFMVVAFVATVPSLACPPGPTPPDAAAPMVTADGAADASDGAVDLSAATCANWCAHAASLKCEAATPTAKGATCAEVCGNAQTGPIHWNLKCKIAAKTCAAADACQ